MNGVLLVFMTETSTTVESEHTPATRWNETAYEWLQRSQQLRAQAAIPRDPSSAAWAFVRRPNTGVSFVDAALKRRQAPGVMPVVEIRGNLGTGKTSTLVTLAARFVVETCPLRFQGPNQESALLPQVVILDGNQDMAATRIACAVRSILLRQCDDLPHDKFDSQMASCLDRIHIVFSGGVASTGCVSTLESLRCKLSESPDHPTLVLWDGFLAETSEVSERMEVVRQLQRFLRDCTIFMVVACPYNSRIPGGYDKLVTHRIRLDQAPVTGGHDFSAFLHGQDTPIPYSLSLGGVLS